MNRNDEGIKPGPRNDSPQKPAGPAPKDERRETQERLAEAMGGAGRGNAKDALKDDPGLSDTDGKRAETGTAKPGSKEGGGRG